MLALRFHAVPYIRNKQLETGTGKVDTKRTLLPHIPCTDEARLSQSVHERADGRRLDEVYDEVVFLQPTPEFSWPLQPTEINRISETYLIFQLSLPTVDVYHAHGIPRNVGADAQDRRRRGPQPLPDPLEECTLELHVVPVDFACLGEFDRAFFCLSGGSVEFG